LERYRETAFTRWLESTFGEMTGIMILGAGLALYAFVYYLHTKAIASKPASEEAENDRRKDPD
jgi:hypothetical protein